jgi:hypothetical protein
MNKKQYIFNDLQVGSYSSHTTLDGLCDMLLEGARGWLGTDDEQEGDREFVESFERGDWTEKRKLNYIKNHDYEPILVTDEVLEEEGISREHFEEFGLNK